MAGGRAGSPLQLLGHLVLEIKGAVVLVMSKKIWIQPAAVEQRIMFYSDPKELSWANESGRTRCEERDVELCGEDLGHW